MRLLSHSLLAALLGSTAVSGVAHAIGVTAQFGFAPIGTVQYTGTDLQNATSLTFPTPVTTNGFTTPALTVNSLGNVNYDGSPNQFQSGPVALNIGAGVTLASNVLTVGTVCTVNCANQQFGYLATPIPNFITWSLDATPNASSPTITVSTTQTVPNTQTTQVFPVTTTTTTVTTTSTSMITNPTTAANGVAANSFFTSLGLTPPFTLGGVCGAGNACQVSTATGAPSTTTATNTNSQSVVTANNGVPVSNPVLPTVGTTSNTTSHVNSSTNGNVVTTTTVATTTSTTVATPTTTTSNVTGTHTVTSNVQVANPGYPTGAGDNDRFSFTLRAIRWSSSGVDNLSFVAIGTFVDSLGVYDTTQASLSLSATQAGPGVAPNVSLVFADPPPPGLDLPEPASLAVLASGAAGLGLLRRRRAARA